MTPAPPETTAEILHRVRQQLILAQVRLMELEDIRDHLTGRLEDTDALLAAAQRLADQKSEEAGHLAKVRDELQGQFEHLRHMQHVTNEALNLTRTELTTALHDRDQRQQELNSLGERALRLNEQVALLNENLRQLGRELADSRALAAARLEQISRLENKIQSMETTRSWRWTGWLRSIGRALGRRPS